VVQQQPVNLHKIIFTITCEGETLYDAQKFATDITGALENRYKGVLDGVTIEMTVEKKDVFKVDTDSVGFTDITTTVWDDKTPYTLTGNCDCKRTVNSFHHSL